MVDAEQWSAQERRSSSCRFCICQRHLQRQHPHGGGRLIVYVESNFILELALGQEQATDAERLLTLAETGRVELAFPAFSVFEAVWEVTNRAAVRRRIDNDLRGEITRLSRTTSYQSLIDEMSAASAALRNVEGLEDAELDQLVTRLLTAGRCLATSDDVLRTMFALRQTHGLTRPDALILASVVNDLASRPGDESKWFISRDRRAFSQSAILATLNVSGCRFLTTLADGVRVVTRPSPS